MLFICSVFSCFSYRFPLSFPIHQSVNQSFTIILCWMEKVRWNSGFGCLQSFEMPHSWKRWEKVKRPLAVRCPDALCADTFNACHLLSYAVKTSQQICPVSPPLVPLIWYNCLPSGLPWIQVDQRLQWEKKKKKKDKGGPELIFTLLFTFW